MCGEPEKLDLSLICDRRGLSLNAVKMKNRKKEQICFQIDRMFPNLRILAPSTRALDGRLWAKKAAKSLQFRTASFRPVDECR